MRILDAIWLRFLATAQRVYEEERGDSMVNWVVLALGLAIAAAALVALLGPAISAAGQKIVQIISG
jgi:uncharacterized membrane protein